MNEEFYYVHELVKGDKHAGSKAREDLDYIFSEKGSPLFSYSQNESDSFLSKFKYIVFPSKVRFCNNMYHVKDKIVFLQYPFYCDSFLNKVFQRILQNNKIILFIHDVESWRNPASNFVKELNIFNQCDVIVAHNDKMAARLKMGGRKRQ